MKNADMPANPARVLDPEVARALKDSRGELGMSLQKVKEMASLAPGITKREHFAAMAMQGMLAHSTRYKPRDEDSHHHWHKGLSKEAVDIADALLTELECTQ